MRRGSIALALVLAAASPALAQNVPEQPAPSAAPAQDPVHRFQAYVTSDGYKNFIGQIAARGDSITAPDCAEHKPTQRAGLMVFKAPSFQEGMHPVDGLWADRIKVDRCGKPALQNILIQASPDGKPPRAALMVPGTSLTSPPMQDEIIKEILAGLAKKKCTDQTQIVPFDSKKDKDIKPIKLDEKGRVTEGAWKETWTVRACGKMVTATVDIGADGKGGLTSKVKM